MKSSSFFLILILSVLLPFSLIGQDSVKTRIPLVVDYNNPKEYVISGVEISGVKFLNIDQIKAITGFIKGNKIAIPGDEISSAIKRLWAQRFFSDIKIDVYRERAGTDSVYINVQLKERPRVSVWDITGVRNSDRKTLLEEKLNFRKGSELSEYVISSSEKKIRDYMVDKGYLNAEVHADIRDDSVISNAVRVTFVVNKKEKVKIKKIIFEGNDHVSNWKLSRAMKSTKDMSLWNIFNSKKFNAEGFKKDKVTLIDAFREKGFRDARIVKDSLYYVAPNRLDLKIKIDEGKRYYFRNIDWVGNSLYTDDQLNSILKIGKGDIYDVVTMNERIYNAEQGNISKAYMDQGYLFFNVNPVEKTVEGDSVDVEIRIHEGKPATIDRVMISGNTITNERVIRRELRTRPGYLYRQTDFENSLRMLAASGQFDPEKLFPQGEGWNIIPNQSNNTVDISYRLTEKPNSTFNIAGGWGGGTFVGQLGVSFNNFSLRRIFDKKAWRPVPFGDAQSLSLSLVTNGSYYSAFSVSFTEPWLFANKPTSFSLSAYYTRQTASTWFQRNSSKRMEVFGLAAGLGTRLKWPDSEFVLYNELSAQVYKLTDWDYYFIFKQGASYNLSWKIRLQRNSTDQIEYPRTGSDFQLGLQITPPYSLFRKNADYKNMSDAEKYKWIEYHKWTFKGVTYTPLTKDLVLMTRAQFGYLGYFNSDLGYSPFEGFILGGDGMSGYNTYGSEIIGQRGYPNSSLTPRSPTGMGYSGNLYDKFTLELRYPIVMQQSSSIYALIFLEGGNAWSHIRDFNPFQIKRSAGIGVRVRLQIIGTLGIDWGYGFDPDPTRPEKKRSGSNFHFSLGQQF